MEFFDCSLYLDRSALIWNNLWEKCKVFLLIWRRVQVCHFIRIRLRHHWDHSIGLHLIKWAISSIFLSNYSVYSENSLQELLNIFFQGLVIRLVWYSWVRIFFRVVKEDITCFWKYFFTKRSYDWIFKDLSLRFIAFWIVALEYKKNCWKFPLFFVKFWTEQVEKHHQIKYKVYVRWINLRILGDHDRYSEAGDTVCVVTTFLIV